MSSKYPNFVELLKDMTISIRPDRPYLKKAIKIDYINGDSKGLWQGF